jgi:PAS domain S-box-containing protein
VIDPERKIQFMNGPAERLTGWTNEHAAGTDIALVLPLEEASGASANEIFFLSVAPEPVRQMPRGMTARHLSGTPFAIEGEIGLSLDDGKVAGAVINFRDATSRLAQENEIRHQHKMQAVGRLAAGVAHDFNELLFVILGYSDELLNSSGLSDSDLLSLQQIQKAADSAAIITRQLLQFSHKASAKKQDVNLNEVINGLEDFLQRSLRARFVKWRFNLDPNLGKVWADPGELTQVLMNLVTNARYAMPEGGRLVIETANVDVPRANSAANVTDPCIVLIVKDTGSGMSPEAATQLFEPFFTTKDAGRGAGLGLSIVHSIVSGLDGTIRVSSDPRSGTTFTVCFPRAVGTTDLPVPPVSVIDDELAPLHAETR